MRGPRGGRSPLKVICNALAVCALISAACQKQKSEPGERELSPAEQSALRSALSTYAEIAWAAYADSVLGARALSKKADEFLRAPSAEGFAELRGAWVRARPPYSQTEVLRFYDGPIDKVELLINTWPIDENYVEAGALGGKPGIVEDTHAYPDLSAPLLVRLNAREGETSISTGYHVIEYLLWGRDTASDGPGKRPHTDYAISETPVALRRGQYLRLSIEQLIRELESLERDWAKDRPDNYRAKFLGMPPLQALALAVKGMGALSGPELAGERLTVAYETKDQENEHSCFSDTTLNDLSDNVLGIQNLCTGSYRRANGNLVEGPGLCAAFAERSPELAQRLERQIAESLTAVRAIPPPFDQAILGSDSTPGRKAVAGAIAALERQTQTLTDVAVIFELRAAPPKPAP
jgi:putative iron-regulated protein